MGSNGEVGLIISNYGNLPPARWLAVGIGAWQVLMYLIRPSLQPSPVAFMFGGLIIWYLLTKNAKEAFQHPPPLENSA